MMKQATMRVGSGYSADQYLKALERVRAIAARNWPGLHVKGIRLIGGALYAITDVGEISVSSISRLDFADEVSETRSTTMSDASFNAFILSFMDGKFVRYFSKSIH